MEHNTGSHIQELRMRMGAADDRASRNGVLTYAEYLVSLGEFPQAKYERLAKQIAFAQKVDDDKESMRYRPRGYRFQSRYA